MTLRDFAENVQAGPERLAEIEDRLATLDRLKRKYGPTLKEVTRFRGGERAAAGGGGESGCADGGAADAVRLRLRRDMRRRRGS